MGVVSTVAIFSFICLVLVYQTDGAGMTLSSNSAFVGQPVILQCVYNGSSTPVTLNFYLGSDIIGLQIYVPVCSYASSTGYDITLYDKNCGAKAVNLTIKSAAASDNGKTWQCDASFFSGPSEAKVSTTITVTAESSGFSTGLTAGAIAGIVIAVVFFLLVHVILIILIIRHCCHGLSTGALIGIAITSFLFAAVEVALIYFIFQYCCKKNPDSSQPDKKLNSTKNKKSPVEPGTGKQHPEL